MKTKIIFLLLPAFCFTANVFSQSLYLLKYAFDDGTANPRETEVLMYRNDNGTGFFRERYFDDSANTYTVIDWDMDEYIGLDENGKEDTNRIDIDGTNAAVIMGDEKLESADVLEFKFIYDAETDLFVPDYALFRTKIDDDNYEDDEMKFTDAILLDEKDLTAELIKKFFKPDEEIYQNYVTEETASVRPLTPQEKQTKLMLLVVANTEDEEIGATCVKDKDRMLKTFGDLAEFLQIQFVPKTIFGADYNKKNVDDAINALKPSPNDIVVFYYTGHGFGYIQNNNELFPYIALTAKSFEDPVKNSLNMENVFERIKSKGARMNLVLSDCCNSDINGRNTIVGDFASTRPSQLPWDTANCRKLFLESKISILGTAAKKGEYSAGTGSLGGIFTYNFRTAMVTFLSKFNNYKPSWPQILKSAEMSTAEKADRTTCNNPNGTSDKCNQHPVFVIK